MNDHPAPSDKRQPLAPAALEEFSNLEQDTIHRLILARRDIRQFRSDPISDSVLFRILAAAHAAPSVGLMQPWNFILIDSLDVRSQIKSSFEAINTQERLKLKGDPRSDLYGSLKLEGILEAPLNIAVTCDHSRSGPFVLGHAPMPRTAAYSVCLAVENLWLAARVEGVGVGWVSILDPEAVSTILKLPPEIELIAYLCIGHPIEFRPKPMLEEVGWKNRERLQTFVFANQWGNPRKLTGARIPLLEQPLPTPDTALTQAAQLKIDRKTKPLGSLGVLEKVAVRLASLQQTVEPRLARKRICVFAGTHGVAAEGVSAYPSEVTGQMVLNFLNGGAAINVLARHAGIDLHIIDTGVDTSWPEEIANRPNFFMRSIRRGTRNFLNEPAMSPEECERAIDIGREQAQKAREEGVDVLGIGEMGIGNTTAASCLLAVFCGFSPAEAVGRGTGVTDSVLTRKVDVLSRALERYATAASDLLGPSGRGAPARNSSCRGGATADGLPRHSEATADTLSRHSEATAEELGLYWLQVVGGFEIAAMTGAILAATEIRLPLVVDGFIATAAAAAAFRINPKSRDICFFSHRSNEQAHGKALRALGVEPLLDLKMRLGEGTGAALAMPILEAAAKLLSEMATFDSASVSGAIPDQEQSNE